MADSTKNTPRIAHPGRDVSPTSEEMHSEYNKNRRDSGFDAGRRDSNVSNISMSSMRSQVLTKNMKLVRQDQVRTDQIRTEIKPESKLQTKHPNIPNVKPVRRGSATSQSLPKPLISTNSNPSAMTSGPIPYLKDSDGIVTRNDTLYLMECGKLQGHLSWQRFLCPGINNKCIQLDSGEWLTPKEVVFRAEKESLKDWKRAIKIEGTNVRTLLDKSLLDYYDHGNHCSNQCRSNKGDYAPPNMLVQLKSNSFDSSTRSRHPPIQYQIEVESNDAPRNFYSDSLKYPEPPNSQTSQNISNACKSSPAPTQNSISVPKPCKIIRQTQVSQATLQQSLSLPNHVRQETFDTDAFDDASIFGGNVNDEDQPAYNISKNTSFSRNSMYRASSYHNINTQPKNSHNFQVSNSPSAYYCGTVEGGLERDWGLDRSVDRSLNRSFDRNVDRNDERNLDRNMYCDLDRSLDRGSDRNLNRSVDTSNQYEHFPGQKAVGLPLSSKTMSSISGMSVDELETELRPVVNGFNATTHVTFWQNLKNNGPIEEIQQLIRAKTERMLACLNSIKNEAEITDPQPNELTPGISLTLSNLVASLKIDEPLQEIIRNHDHKCDREELESERKLADLSSELGREHRRCETFKRRRQRQSDNIMSAGGNFNLIHEQHRNCSLVGVSGVDIFEKRPKLLERKGSAGALSIASQYRDGMNLEGLTSLNPSLNPTLNLGSTRNFNNSLNGTDLNISISNSDLNTNLRILP